MFAGSFNHCPRSFSPEEFPVQCAMRVTLFGASGLLGQELVHELSGNETER